MSSLHHAHWHSTPSDQSCLSWCVLLGCTCAIVLQHHQAKIAGLMASSILIGVWLQAGGILDKVKVAAEDKSAEGGLFAVKALAETKDATAEAYLVAMLPIVLDKYADKVSAVHFSAAPQLCQCHPTPLSFTNNATSQRCYPLVVLCITSVIQNSLGRASRSVAECILPSSCGCCAFVLAALQASFAELRLFCFFHPSCAYAASLPYVFVKTLCCCPAVQGCCNSCSWGCHSCAEQHESQWCAHGAAYAV